jgi:hypothetical protein
VRVPLTERQRAILEFERTWWTQDEEKDLLIRRRFACAPTTYYEELNEVLQDPDAVVADPLVVRRLVRLRERRVRARLDGSGAQASGGSAQ